MFEYALTRAAAEQVRSTARLRSRMVNKRGSILNEERHRAIVDFVNQNGRAVVRELAPRFGTSEITIRRDLEMLHERGLLYRTHGGALPIRAAAESDRNLTERELQHPREKMRIAAAAARLVQKGQSIVLDSGSTTTAIARAIRDLDQLTVITNAINIAAELADSRVDVILTGGLLRKNSFSLVGPLAEETLRHLKADMLFLGIDGFDTHHGLSTPNMLEAQLNRAMVDIVVRVIAVCDSSKFGRRSLASIVPVSRIHAVITDKQIPKSDLKALKDAKIEVILV
jgi:DeoR family transcriptional regulator, aga operon transcriptional repressor